MQMDPEYIPVGELFNNNTMYIVAKYQRSYSWKEEHLEDFFQDLTNCFNRRKSDNQSDHFFGGILSVAPFRQSVGKSEFELIDGQQRITTFTLLIAALVDIYKQLKATANLNNDNENSTLIQERIENLSNRYIQFTKQVSRQRTPFDVLRLSSADKDFYKSLIHGQQVNPSRVSHENIQNAYSFFKTKIDSIITSHALLTDKMDDLEIIEQVVDNDFCVIHIVSYNKNDAFRLFQVINDRGMSLTDGDLLRSRTLEMTDENDIKQNQIELKWNSILAEESNTTAKYLKWIFESYKGKSPKNNALYDMFLEDFFPMSSQQTFSQDDIENITNTVVAIDSDVKKCRSLISGQWYYPHQQPVTGWDRNRLDLLMSKLGHDLAMPLLLAGLELDHRIFSELIQILEKAFFRYKLICNQHVGSLKNIYYEEALRIRSNPSTYNLNTLKTKLRKLIHEKANDNIFSNALKILEYKESGGSNKTLKYLLFNVEYFFEWYINGANGTPRCLDKSRIYDFNDTSIEHIYPRNPLPNEKDSNIEPIKNTLGNLSIMDPTQNTLSGNEKYTNKINTYKCLSVNHLKNIAENNTEWSTNEINENEKFIINLALKVFTI